MATGKLRGKSANYCCCANPNNNLLTLILILPLLLILLLPLLQQPFTALCPGLPGWAGTRRNVHPLTYPDHHPTFISFFHLLRSIACSFLILILLTLFYPPPCTCILVSDIAVFVLKRDVKLQPTNQPCTCILHVIKCRANTHCLEGKRENNQVCSVQYCVQQLCTVQCTHMWTDLTVLCIGFCLTGPISLCVDSFLCMYYFVYIACMCSIVTWWGAPGGIEAYA